MFVKDTAIAARQRQKDAVLAQRARVNKWVADELNQARIMDEKDLSPANAERQLGQPKTSADLEVIIKRLNPTLSVDVNPFTHKKVIYRLMPDGTRHYVCAFESGFMPEYSIMKGKEEWVPDPSIPRGEDGEPIFTGQDPNRITQGQLQNIIDRNGTDYAIKWLEQTRLNRQSARYGFKRILKPWGEQIRGWRTVLAILVRERLATPEAVERLTGVGQRVSWAAHMGRDAVSPW